MSNKTMNDDALAYDTFTMIILLVGFTIVYPMSLALINHLIGYFNQADMLVNMPAQALSTASFILALITTIPTIALIMLVKERVFTANNMRNRRM